jgi:hypothetical protein
MRAREKERERGRRAHACTANTRLVMDIHMYICALQKTE